MAACTWLPWTSKHLHLTGKAVRGWPSDWHAGRMSTAEGGWWHGTAPSQAGTLAPVLLAPPKVHHRHCNVPVLPRTPLQCFRNIFRYIHLPQQVHACTHIHTNRVHIKTVPIPWYAASYLGRACLQCRFTLKFLSPLSTSLLDCRSPELWVRGNHSAGGLAPFSSPTGWQAMELPSVKWKHTDPGM